MINANPKAAVFIDISRFVPSFIFLKGSASGVHSLHKTILVVLFCPR
jgi:hypothetical protein